MSGKPRKPTIGKSRLVYYQFRRPLQTTMRVPPVPRFWGPGMIHSSLPHRLCRPARDETVPHSSSAFCSMSGKPQRPTIGKSPSRLLPVQRPFQTTMRVPPVPRSWGPGIIHSSLPHRLCPPARDEVVPHSSSAFCSMSGKPQRPTIGKSPSRLLPVPETSPEHNEGAPGPSLLGTGDHPLITPPLSLPTRER
jgi:hypothetical protein